VKRRENGGNLVSLMLASNQFDCEGVQIFEGDIVKFVHGGIRTGIVECRPEHFCYWQVKVPGDHFGLGWVVNCCTGIVVTGNRYADREWLEDKGLAGLLDDEFVNQAATNIAEAVEEMDRMLSERAAKHPEDFFASPKLATTSIDPDKEKTAKEAMEKLKIFSTEDWARDYSKIHFEPDKKEEICADEPGVPISPFKPADPEKESDEFLDKQVAGGKKIATVQEPARIESDYRDDDGRKIKDGDILTFKLCGRRFSGEVLKIFSPETAKSSWQVWTYDSPGMKLSLRHMCEDVTCSEVRVIGHISTVRQGGVAVQDIGIQL
jgi:YopX protein.